MVEISSARLGFFHHTLCQGAHIAVSCPNVPIFLLVAVLNAVDIWAADVLNAYIITPCQENTEITLGKCLETIMAGRPLSSDHYMT